MELRSGNPECNIIQQVMPSNKAQLVLMSLAAASCQPQSTRPCARNLQLGHDYALSILEVLPRLPPATPSCGPGFDIGLNDVLKMHLQGEREEGTCNAFLGTFAQVGPLSYSDTPERAPDAHGVNFGGVVSKGSCSGTWVGTLGLIPAGAPFPDAGVAGLTREFRTALGVTPAECGVPATVCQDEYDVAISPWP